MEKRQHERIQLDDTIILNPTSVCQLRDISLSGLCFNCVCGQDFPEEWHIDILDTAGNHIEGLTVEKVWENWERKQDPSMFSLAVGVKFKFLSSQQQANLQQMLSRKFPHTIN